VIHRQRSPKAPRTANGFFAALRAFLRPQGTGAPSYRSRLLLLLLGLVFLAPFAASAVAPAAAAIPPNCRPTFAAFTGDPAARTLTSVVLGGTAYTAVPEPGCEAQWTIEWSTTPNGPWQEFPGGHGTVNLAEGSAHFQTGELTGLEPETTYYQRATLTVNSTVASEESGTFESKPLHPFGAGVEAENASITEASAHLTVSVQPSPFETHWRLEYSASRAELENDEGTLVSQGTITQAEAEALQNAIKANIVPFEADLTGLEPSTAYYLRAVAEDEPEWPPSSGEFRHKEFVSGIRKFETHGPPVAEASGTPAIHGETLRLLGYVIPHGFDTHYRFQYGETEAYGSETPEEDAGSGGASGIEATAAAADLPGLEAGHTYHYRIAATSAAAGGTTVYGADHTLTVPIPGEGEEPQAPCPNQALRTGASARLPDCRAYEQVTPAEKGGAQQAFSYGNQINFGALIGEDGDHLLFQHPLVHWGTGLAPYFFARDPHLGWQMTPGTAQPEAGFDTYTPELFNPNLTRFAFSAEWHTGVAMSPEIEFKSGLPGGPYPTIASIPRAQTRLQGGLLGWVAASQDFSKLILATTDRTLVPAHPTGTASGADLYEYSAGALRQANVDTAGATIGSCGASVARGIAEPSLSHGTTAHSLSADGSRLFFYAVPTGEACSEPTHLYLRTDGGQPDAETTDLGPYAFLAANSQGTELLLEAPGAATQQILLYDTATATAKPLLTLHEDHNGGNHLTLFASEDLSTFYLHTQEQLTSDAPPPTGDHALFSHDLYRYDLAAETLRFVAQQQGFNEFYVTPDGRFASWRSESPAFYAPGAEMPRQEILYDSVHNLIQCASCGFSFNPEPQLPTAAHTFGNSGVLESPSPAPKHTLLAADGRRLFFDTRASLLPADVDGESPEPDEPGGTKFWSPSSDVYEWRANGVEGCPHIQGCLALISTGRGGYLVQLLGADASGENVFFTTQEQLVPADKDTSVDIYDARSGGGYPLPPQRPVECQGDACSNPVPAPNDPTPSSEQFHGAGNEHPVGHKHHKKHHRKKHHKRAHKRAANTHRRAGK